MQYSGPPACLDPYGHVLGALPLKGKARDIRHDEVVMEVAKDLSYCGIETRVEPRGMVNSWMTPAAFVNMNNAEGARPLQGCIPDLHTREPPPGGGAPQEQLYDLKVINQCKTRYPPNQTARFVCLFVCLLCILPRPGRLCYVAPQGPGVCASL